MPGRKLKLEQHLHLSRKRMPHFPRLWHGYRTPGLAGYYLLFQQDFSTLALHCSNPRECLKGGSEEVVGLVPCISDWAEKESFVSLENRWFPVDHCYGRHWYRSLRGQVMLFCNSYTCSELRKSCSLWKQPVTNRRYSSISPQGSNAGKCIKEGANKKLKIPSMISTITAKKKKKSWQQIYHSVDLF